MPDAPPLLSVNPETGPDWSALLTLLQICFAFRDGRIDPPSSLHRLNADGLQAKAEREDLFVITQGTDLIACMFGRPKDTHYYIGKLAVSPAHRGSGLATLLIEAAALRAEQLALKGLELETRIELTENHATFAALGFHVYEATAHPGFARPTSFTFRRSL